VYIPKLLSVLIFAILPVSNILAQRGHEFQFQVGTYWNRQDSFYDFFESGGNIRHTYEIEQTYSARFQTFSWRYPINGYLEVGLFFSKSTDGTLKLFEQESAVLNSPRGGYIEKVEKFKSRWGLASGRLEVVSDDEIGSNSPFARILLNYLRQNPDNEFPVSQLIQDVKIQVSEVSEQTPIGNPLRLSGDEGGKFIFRKAND